MFVFDLSEVQGYLFHYKIVMKIVCFPLYVLNINRYLLGDSSRLDHTFETETEFCYCTPKLVFFIRLIPLIDVNF